MKLMDKDGSGSVDFKEFCNVMADQFYKEPTQKELEAAFDYFDQGFYFKIFNFIFMKKNY